MNLEVERQRKEKESSETAVHDHEASLPTACLVRRRRRLASSCLGSFCTQFTCGLLGEATTKGDESLKLLVHPVVQIAKGVVKLVPTRQFIPLRFHIARILTELQAKTGAFIPILPLALQVLSLTDFSGKAAAKFSVRPLNLQCCLKADPAETGYHKAVADAIYDTILGVCQVLGSDIAFPELMTQPMFILKTFLRNKCRNAEVARRFKTLLEKVEANAVFVSEKRAAAMDAGLVHLGDEKSVQVRNRI